MIDWIRLLGDVERGDRTPREVNLLLTAELRREVLRAELIGYEKGRTDGYTEAIGLVQQVAGVRGAEVTE